MDCEGAPRNVPGSGQTQVEDLGDPMGPAGGHCVASVAISERGCIGDHVGRVGAVQLGAFQAARLWPARGRDRRVCRRAGRTPRAATQASHIRPIFGEYYGDPRSVHASSAGRSRPWSSARSTRCTPRPRPGRTRKLPAQDHVQGAATGQPVPVADRRDHRRSTRPAPPPARTHNLISPERRSLLGKAHYPHHTLAIPCPGECAAV